MLAGEEEMSFRPEFMPGHFVHKGSLESVMSESSAMRTATESIADSHIYNELASDMSGFARFYEKERQKEIAKEDKYAAALVHSACKLYFAAFVLTYWPCRNIWTT